MTFGRRTTIQAIVWSLVIVQIMASTRLNAQDSITVRTSWRLIEVKDDLTNKSDLRLVVESQDSVSDRLGGWVRPVLIVACGDVFRSNDNRTMVLDAQMPLRWTTRPPVGDLAEVVTRTNVEDKPTTLGPLMFFDAGHTTVYLGGFSAFYFNSGFFKRLLLATEVRIRFEPLQGNTVETVTFHVENLAEAVEMLPTCKWPRD